MHPSEHPFTPEHTPVSAIPLPAWWFAPDSQQVFTNATFQAFTGAAAQTGLEQLFNWIHPSDLAALQEVLQKQPAENTRCYYRLKNKEGKFRWHCHTWSPYPSAAETVGYMNILQDIHELYRRDAFYKSRFEEIFNETFQFTGLLDPEGRLLEANRSALKFGGIVLEDIIGQYFWKAGWWQQSDQIPQRLEGAVKAAAAGNFIRSEETVFGHNGTALVIDFSLKPLYNESGELMYLIAEGRDITELKQARNKLKDSEIKWQTLVENTPDLVVRHNKKLEYTFINRAVEVLTGLTPQHFLGKKPEEVALPQEQSQRYLQALRRALEEKIVVEYTAEVKTRKGFRSMLLTVTPELNEQQEIESLLVLTRDITELKDKEKQLASTNQELSLINMRLRNILDSTNDAMCSRDMNMRILAFNKAYEKEHLVAFGSRPQIGQTIEEALKHLPAELERVKVLWQRALKGEAFTILQEFGDPQFSRNYYEVNFNPIYDPRGQQVGATIAGKDITGARKIEKELKDAREFLILAENIPHIIFTTDANGRPDYVNQAFHEYTGLQKVDLSSPFGPVLVHPDDLRFIRTRWIRSVRNTEGLQQEIRFKYHTGEYRWNLVRFIPLVAAEGNVYKWIGSATDIHEAKVAEEKQRLAAQEFRQLAESLPLIIWTTNAQGELNYMNNKWYEYTGLSQGQVSSGYWEDHIHPDDLEQTLQSWAHSVAQKEEYLVEYRLRNKEGEYRWFLGMGTPLINSEGAPVKWFGSSTDIHDQKQQNRRLWQQNLQLNQINQYLDNFVHTAAHDLRAPIANIKGLLSLFDLASADKKEQIIKNLHTSANRLDSTLQGMIQLIEAQNQRSDISRNINIEEVFAETIADFSNELAGVKHEISSDLQACREFTFVLPYLRSIFRNLLSNSIKYRKPDELLKISISCQPEEDFIAITYQDNGIGIDMERNGKNMFRPFKRFTKQASGKGIGMHIVKNMLVKTGGRISVSSKPGQGVSFRLHLRNLHDTQQEELNQALGQY